MFQGESCASGLFSSSPRLGLLSTRSVVVMIPRTGDVLQIDVTERLVSLSCQIQSLGKWIVRSIYTLHETGLSLVVLI